MLTTVELTTTDLGVDEAPLSEAGLDFVGVFVASLTTVGVGFTPETDVVISSNL